jgi:hypothetical protein
MRESLLVVVVSVHVATMRISPPKIARYFDTYLHASTVAERSKGQMDGGIYPLCPRERRSEEIRTYACSKRLVTLVVAK